MRQAPAPTLLLPLLLLVSSGNGFASAKPAPTANQVAPSAFGALAQGGLPRTQASGWATHNDPKGFAMDAPPGWSFSSDPRGGRVVVQGPQGEQVVVWPVSVEQSLDARRAQALVQQLARQVDAQMPWGTATAVNGAVRTIAKGPQRSGGDDDVVKRAERHAGTILLRGSAGHRVPRGDGYIRSDPEELSRSAGGRTRRADR